MSACRSCGAPIIWVRGRVSGKPMPLDPEPVRGGNVEVLTMLGDSEPTAKVLYRDPDRVAYVTHFSTCPNAASHRRPRSDNLQRVPEPEEEQSGTR